MEEKPPMIKVLKPGTRATLLIAFSLFVTTALLHAQGSVAPFAQPDVPHPTHIGIQVTPEPSDPLAVRIVWVVPDGPAAKAGLQPGDVILRVDGQHFDNQGVAAYIGSKEPGTAITIEYERGGKTSTAVVTAEEETDSERAAVLNHLAPPSFVDMSMSVDEALHTIAVLGPGQLGTTNCLLQFQRTKLALMDSAGKVTNAISWGALSYVQVQDFKHLKPHYGYELLRHGDDPKQTFDQLARDRSACKAVWLLSDTEEQANQSAAAVNRLIWQNSPEMALRRQLEFEAAAAAWRATSVKPPMPEDAHEHQVLAENAYREKDLNRTVDEYQAALEIFPTWPDGQSNLAMICGEVEDYGCAVEHIEDYLKLVPNAPDAQAAKDKLIIWKDKLAQLQAQAPPPPAQPAPAHRKPR
jgi:membrane-associated protease RseP (regulator of RpoE activity)